MEDIVHSLVGRKGNCFPSEWPCEEYTQKGKQVALEMDRAVLNRVDFFARLSRCINGVLCRHGWKQFLESV